jgi:hypothetical protein
MELGSANGAELWSQKAIELNWKGVWRSRAPSSNLNHRIWLRAMDKFFLALIFFGIAFLLGVIGIALLAM